MPEISRFLGIIIYMYAKDHEPPHFHAHYQGFRSSWTIHDLKMTVGELLPRIERLVKEWALSRREELIDNWAECKNGKQPRKLSPL